MKSEFMFARHTVHDIDRSVVALYYLSGHLLHLPIVPVAKARITVSSSLNICKFTSTQVWRSSWVKIFVRVTLIVYRIPARCTKVLSIATVCAGSDRLTLPWLSIIFTSWTKAISISTGSCIEFWMTRAWSFKAVADHICGADITGRLQALGCDVFCLPSAKSTSSDDSVALSRWSSVKLSSRALDAGRVGGEWQGTRTARFIAIRLLIYITSSTWFASRILNDIRWSVAYSAWSSLVCIVIACIACSAWVIAISDKAEISFLIWTKNATCDIRARRIGLTLTKIVLSIHKGPTWTCHTPCRSKRCFVSTDITNTISAACVHHSSVVTLACSICLGAPKALV